MTLIVNVEIADPAWNSLLKNAPALARRAVKAAEAQLQENVPDGELNIALAGDEEVAALNTQWRGKPKPTNVLSFPSGHGIVVPPGEPRPLGDIILASGVVSGEADEQRKPLAEHFTHLVVHGFLHIMGYDHLNDEEADEMESLEAEILAKLGIANPYE